MPAWEALAGALPHEQAQNRAVTPIQMRAGSIM